MTILYSTGMKYREVIYAPRARAQFCQTLRTLTYFCQILPKYGRVLKVLQNCAQAQGWMQPARELTED